MEHTGWARLYLWAAERLYNEFAWAYDLVSWLVSLGRWSRWRRAVLDHLGEGRILEIGFGTGALLIEIAARGGFVVGLDPSAAMQRVTARKLRGRSIRVPCVRAYAQSLPFVDGSFDALVATFPSNYVLAPATLQEAARVLRDPNPGTRTPGGRLVIAGLVSRLDPVAGRGAARAAGRSVPANALSRWMRLAAATGFELTVSSAVGRQPPWPVFVLQKRGRTATRVADAEHDPWAES